MFQVQRKRLFPLPDYDIEPDKVAVSILGRIIDSNYVQLLASKPELSLHDVVLLDSVQKGKSIKKGDAKFLRSKNLVEGRYPSLHISSSIAALSKQKAIYMHNRGLDKQHYVNLVMEHIREFGAITRKEADELLIPKLPDILDSKQKRSKVHNILSPMVRDGLILNVGSRPKPKYELVEKYDSGV